MKVVKIDIKKRLTFNFSPVIKCYLCFPNSMMSSSFAPKNQRHCQSCGSAFNRYKNSADRFCTECKGNDYGSAEEDVSRQGDWHPQNGNQSKKLFPNPEKFQKKNLFSSLFSSQTKSCISKRPLKCPFLNCGKYVGVFDLSAHFKYEHKEVPHILTHCDARNSLEFSSEEIKNRSLQTMLLLNLSESRTQDENILETVSSKTSSLAPKEPQTILVLSKKLTEYDLQNKHNEKGRKNTSDELRDTDIWMFWVGSNIATDRSCTIAISTLDNEMRLKYFGPMVHLEEDPINIWANGNCLVLNRFQMEKMSEHFRKNLNLDIIIYQEE